MENEETKKIKYEKPELVEFKWMGAMGACTANGSGDAEYCSGNGNNANNTCSYNGNNATYSCANGSVGD